MRSVCLDSENDANNSCSTHLLDLLPQLRTSESRVAESMLRAHVHTFTLKGRRSVLPRNEPASGRRGLNLVEFVSKFFLRHLSAVPAHPASDVATISADVSLEDIRTNGVHYIPDAKSAQALIDRDSHEYRVHQTSVNILDNKKRLLVALAGGGDGLPVCTCFTLLTFLL